MEKIYISITLKHFEIKNSEIKYKMLHNLTHLSTCSVCKEKEDISHMQYNCPRIKLIWTSLSNCLNLNILLKHIILGVQCDNYICKNKFICIVIVSYTIYSNWYKTSMNKGNYNVLNIK